MSMYAVGGGGHSQYPYGLGFDPTNDTEISLPDEYYVDPNVAADSLSLAVDSIDLADLSIGLPEDFAGQSSLADGLISSSSAFNSLDMETPTVDPLTGNLFDASNLSLPSVDTAALFANVPDVTVIDFSDMMSVSPDLFGLVPKEPDWTDTLADGVKAGFGYLGDFVKKNPDLLTAGAGYLFSRKMKDDMRQSGYTKAQTVAAATAARAAMVKKRPAWVMPVVIGGSILVVGLITWLALSGGD